MSNLKYIPLLYYVVILIIWIIWAYKLWHFSRFSGSGGFDNTVYQQQQKHQGNTPRIRQNHLTSHKRPRFSSSTSQKQHGQRTVLSQRRHKKHNRPTFAGPIHNVTVNVGREATLDCLVNHLDKYKVIAHPLGSILVKYNMIT